MSAIAVHFSVARLKTTEFCARLVLAALFLFTGGAKLTGLPATVEVFERVVGQWFLSHGYS
jgi:uncharacterized membrane protein YphA (DoxX/SURF4 family)